MDRRRFLAVGSSTLLSGLVPSTGRGEVPETGMYGDEREAYAKYIEQSSEFELLRSGAGIDWIVVEQVDSPCMAVKIELLRLDRPEWSQEVRLPLDVGCAWPMVSVVGPAPYEASASFDPNRRGGSTEFRFEGPIQVKIYRANREFREVIVVAA